MKTQYIRGILPLHIAQIAAAATLVFAGIFILCAFINVHTAVAEVVNTAPVAVESSFTVAEGNMYSGVVTGTDIDIDGDPLIFQLTIGPSYGTLTLNADGSFNYTANQQPNVGFVDTDSFTFIAYDGELVSEPASVSITITPVNDAPEALVDAFTVESGATHNGSVAGTDADGDALTFAQASSPMYGSLSFNAPAGTFTYTADHDYDGPDSFTFTANDGLLDSAPATIDITIEPVPPKLLSSQLLDEVLPDSLSDWSVYAPGGNPAFTKQEITSPYDGSTALKTSVVGNTTSLCNQPSIAKTYTVNGNTSTTYLEAYLAFTSTMEQFTFPYVVVEVFDASDDRVGYQIYYGKDVVGSWYKTNHIDVNPHLYTELPTAEGDVALDLSVMGDDIDFTSLKVTLGNYACVGQTSVTFDHLRITVGTLGGGGGEEEEEDGTLVGELVSPTSPLNVYQDTPFTFTSSVECVGGDCGDVTATLYPKGTTRLLIYNPNVPSPEGDECKGNYGELPYDYLEANGVEVTFWCNDTVVDASVLEDYDVLYVGRARAGYYTPTYIDSADLKDWVSNGGGAILESTGDSFEPGTSDIIWPGIYDLFGYNNCPSIGDSDNGGGGPLTKLIDHPIWEEVEGPVGDSGNGLYDSELYDSCIGTGVKIGDGSANAQNPMVNEFGLGRTYSGVLVNYTINEDSERYFLNVVQWVAQNDTAGAIPMDAGTPFYTTSANPQTLSDVSCLGDMPEDAVCEQTWTVVPTGRVGASYEFFTVYDSSLGAQATTSKVSITILEKEEEPPVVEEPEPRRRSSGSATRVGTRNNEQAGEGQVLGIQTSNQYTERMRYIQLQFIKILTMYVQMLSGAGR